MSEEPNNQEIEAEVNEGMELAKSFVKNVDFGDVQSGEWFIQLLRQVIKTGEQNARASYFQQKYPGMEADNIAGKLITVNSQYAAVAGGIAGVAATANQLTTLASAGLTTSLWLGTLGVEMVYLSWLQIRLVADLAVIYDLQLDPEDPQDILMIFGYALGVTPTEFLGKGVQIAAGATTKTAIKTYISKGTLRTVQDFARKLGFKILQRTIIKYAVPAVSAVIGSSYNYLTTKSVGNIAKSHFKNRGKAPEELRILITRQYKYNIIFPAAILYIAKVDGEYSQVERELYESILNRMSFDEHEQRELQKLGENEENILRTIHELQDEIASKTLLDLLILMAVFDGKLADEERRFLQNVSDTLEISIDMAELEKQAEAYRLEYSDTTWKNVVNITGSGMDIVKELFDKINDWVASWKSPGLDKTESVE